MKFLCDSCKTKYQIPDEKVAGRTLRMKCRKCGHMVAIDGALVGSGGQGPAGGDDGHDGEHVEAPATTAGGLAEAFSALAELRPKLAAEAPLDGWFAGIDGAAVGPMPEGDLRGRVAAGAVGPETLVWREGMGEWVALQTVPGLVAFVEQVRAAAVLAASPAGAPATAGAPSSPPAHASAPPAAPAAEPARSNPPPRPAGGLAALAAAGAAAPGPGLAPAAAPSAPPPAAAASAAPSVTPAAPSVTPVAPAVAAAAPSSPPAAPAVSALDVAASRTSTPPATIAPSLVPPPPARRGMPPAAMAVVGLGGILIGLVGAVALRSPPPPPPAPAAQATAVVPPAATTASPADPEPLASAVPAAASADPVAAVAPAVAKQGSSATARPGPDKDTKPAASAVAPPAGLSALTSLTGGPSVAANPGTKAAGGGAQPLSSAEVERTVQQNSAFVRRQCWEPALGAKTANAPSKARIVASVSVAADGHVQSVNASGGDGYPGLASCVQQRVKGWRFPPSDIGGDINVPFVFAAQ